MISANTLLLRIVDTLEKRGPESEFTISVPRRDHVVMKLSDPGHYSTWTVSILELRRANFDVFTYSVVELEQRA